MSSVDLLALEAALEEFEPVVGLEVHVELSTATKMFSAAPNRFGAPANSCLTPVCLGLPGSLPVVNRQAIAYGISLGLALGCEIAPECVFARKNYFYPDVPKDYQISQYDKPLAFEGSLEVETEAGLPWKVLVERAHLEEDAGKLTHQGGSGRIHDAVYSLVDYNRAGVPLVEIVSRPIFADRNAPQVARAYVGAIRDLVRTLGISEGHMERGNLRCDANVSLRPRAQVAAGVETLGTRTETKNVNSLRAVERAIVYEIRRQAAVLRAGKPVLQETRHWHEDSGATSPGRPKSDADDYRYFPDPDLLPLQITGEQVQELREQLPELPLTRRRRLKAEWNFSDLEMRDVVNSGLVDAVAATVVAGAAPAAARKWWTGELARLAGEKHLPAEELVTPEQVAELETLVVSGELSDSLARQVLEGVIAGEGSPAQVVAARGLKVVGDDDTLNSAIDQALAAQPDVLEKIRAGKVQAAGAIIGEVMRTMQGRADAARVRQLILERAQS